MLCSFISFYNLHNHKLSTWFLQPFSHVSPFKLTTCMHTPCAVHLPFQKTISPIIIHINNSFFLQVSDPIWHGDPHALPLSVALQEIWNTLHSITYIPYYIHPISSYTIFIPFIPFSTHLAAPFSCPSSPIFTEAIQTISTPHLKSYITLEIIAPKEATLEELSTSFASRGFYSSFYLHSCYISMSNLCKHEV